MLNDWLKTSLQERGMKQAELARRLTEAVGKSIDRAAVNKMANGQRNISAAEMRAIEHILGTPAPGGLEEPSQSSDLQSSVATFPIANASPPVPIEFPTTRLPVYGQAVGGDDGRFVLNGQRVSDILCPPQLQGVPNAYGVFVHGESMEPRYYAGEALFLNPNLPVRRGDFVVVQIAGDSEADDAAGYVKRFVSMNSKELVLEQFKPREDVPEDAPEAERLTMRFPRSKVVAVHKIVGTANG